MIALLLVYFCTGLSGLAAVANILFQRNSLHLTAVEIVSLGVWIGLPWSIKVLFGSSIERLGRHHKAYILLANAMVILESLGMSDVATVPSRLSTYLGQYPSLLILGLVGTVGVIIGRLVADTLAIDLGTTPELRARLQVYARVAFAAGGLAGALLAGTLASHFTVAQVFLMATIPPLISSLAILPIRLPKYLAQDVPTGNSLLLPSILFSAGCLAIGLLLAHDIAQLSIFTLSLLVISTLLYRQLDEIPLRTKRYLLGSLLAVFLFRTTPGAGPSLDWYYIGVQHFDPQFLGTLRVTGAVISLLLMFLLRNQMVRANTARVLIALTVAMTLLGLPDILIYYGLNGSINPRHLVLVDSAAAVAVAQLSMIPLGVIIAQSAPQNQRTMYLALTASLLNLALTASELITGIMNRYFTVTRTDFSQLGELLIMALSISTLLSIVGIVILVRTSQENTR